MKTTFRIAAIATLIGLAAFSAEGQITTITASNIVGDDAKPIVQGEIDFLAVTLAGNPIQPRLGGGGVLLYKPAKCLVVNGAITTATNGSACTLADTSLTNQAHFCYKAQVKQTDVTPNTLYPWIPCLQPTGSTWNLDTQYVPANAPTALVQLGPPGPPGPSGGVGTLPNTHQILAGDGSGGAVSTALDDGQTTVGVVTSTKPITDNSPSSTVPAGIDVNPGSSTSYQMGRMVICPNVPAVAFTSVGTGCDLYVGKSTTIADGGSAGIAYLPNATVALSRGALAVASNSAVLPAFEWDLLGNIYLPHFTSMGCLGTDSDGKIGAGTGCSGGIPYPSAGLAASTGSAWRAALFSDVVALWTTCTSGYLKFDGSCGNPAATHAWQCQPGLGDGLNPVPTATYPQNTCMNTTGSTVTLTGFQCFSDDNGTSTVNVTNGSNVALLTGAITCTTTFASGTQSGTTTLANGDYLKFSFVSDGVTKQSTWTAKGTY